ncbi:transcriptional regulator, AraC family [Faunimonas pinastri]|uniref:Transcriptional regulator, AraC family n=1 Tax=Faunimonas pinastri TaxID=1855383 RepID=A0A1H9K5A0_9HYPH|nr:helix-turn-helix domain-containing protein [Faunimonas pinastri]SEQ94361.1 transcriptional regulator, AraC family [Faunimonas pinastri]
MTEERSHARISTMDVPESERIEYWEAYNVASLSGVRCSTHAADGLRVSADHYDRNGFRISDIRGEQHIVERTPEIMKRQPLDSLFACLLLEGDAFFFQGEHCLTLRAGDLLVYDADRPFLYGFTRRMRQILIELPPSTLAGGDADARRTRAVKIDGGIGGGRVLTATLNRALQELMVRHDPASVRACRQVLDEALSGRNSARKFGMLAAAMTIIEENLGDFALRPDFVAHRLRVSPRHLNRLFEPTETTVAEYIRNQRLERARTLLSDCPRGTGIAEIGYRCGFSDPASFSRLFKQRYGTTPLLARQGT